MDNIQKRYGYTGQGLRVNLTTGKITKEPVSYTHLTLPTNSLV